MLKINVQIKNKKAKPKPKITFFQIFANSQKGILTQIFLTRRCYYSDFLYTSNLYEFTKNLF